MCIRDSSYGDQIVITPRNYAFNFRHVGDMKNHYAIIGMAHVAEDYPLYYDADVYKRQMLFPEYQLFLPM